MILSRVKSSSSGKTQLCTALNLGKRLVVCTTALNVSVNNKKKKGEKTGKWTDGEVQTLLSLNAMEEVQCD